MWRWVMRNEVLLFILVGVVLLRIPTLFEPYWYGDEGVYLTVGHALRSGYQLYAQIHDNKPPFLYLVAAVANGYQFWFRFLTLGWNLATVAVFWQLARKWFTDGKGAIWSTVIFALLTNLPLIEGNIGNAELYFLLLTVGGFYWLYCQRSALVGGLLLGLAALFKMPAILDVGVWPLFWLLTAEKGWFKKSFLVGVGALLPLAVSGVYFAQMGTLHSYLVASGLQNIPYLSSWQAPVSMLWRVIITVGLLAVLAILRGKWGHRLLLLGLWWIITLFAALLSGRPYPHYLLQMAPVLALGVAMLISGKQREGYLVAGLVAVLVAAVVAFKFYVYPVGSYYANFLSWIAGQKSKTAYFDSFGPDTGRNYQIARIIDAGTAPTEQIFVWGDQPMIYALSRRLPVGKYTTKYHILDFHSQLETIRQLADHPPRYIISFGAENQLPGLWALIKSRYILADWMPGVEIYRLFDHRGAKRL